MILKTENIKTITIFCNENNCSDTRQMLFFASLNLLPVSKGLFFLRCLIYNMITFFCFNFKNFKTKSNIFPPSIEKVALKRHFPKVKSQRLWSHDCGFFFSHHCAHTSESSRKLIWLQNETQGYDNRQ